MVRDEGCEGMKSQVRIPLARPTFFGEELDLVKEVLESGWWKQGPKVEELEERFADFVKSRNAVAVSSGTAALHIALEISGMRGVVCPDFTWPAVPNSAMILRKNLHLVDVNLGTYNTDQMERDEHVYKVRTLDKKRNMIETTFGPMNYVDMDVALVPTHIFGNPVDMTRVKGKFVVEDAACALGSYLNNRHMGTFGNIGCFSFDPRKLLPTGEGGMLVTDSDEIAEKARLLRWHGFKDGKFVDYGYNFKLTDIQAAVGLVQLKHLPEILDRRAYQALQYHKLIHDLNVPVAPQQSILGAVPNYQAYVVRLPRQISNMAIRAEMLKEGIETQLGTYAVHCQPSFLGLGHDLPVSQMLYETTLALPAYHEMTEEDQVYVIETLKKALGKTFNP